MKIFALGDLHLGHSVDKPMDVFGQKWGDHPDTIRERWEETVHAEDWVLVPGDLSWAMRLEEAEEDLRWLDRLPGKKIIIKGNHDYWWASVSRVRKLLEGSSITVLQYDSVRVGPAAVGGTRLWSIPGIEGFGEEDVHDDKIFRRELGRLDLSICSMEPEATLRIVMTHFPPTDPSGKQTPVTRILEEKKTDICVFGHLHSLPLTRGKTWDFQLNGVRYVLASCDAVGFRPYLLADLPQGSNGLCRGGA